MVQQSRTRRKSTRSRAGSKSSRAKSRGSKSKSNRVRSKHPKSKSNRVKRPRSKSRRIKVRGPIKRRQRAPRVIRTTRCSNKTTNSFITKSKLTSRAHKYLIHDNGGRPFEVVADNRSISVYYHESGSTIINVSRFEGYWRGYDSTQYRQHGNSILIKINPHLYIYVGSEIYEFMTSDVITDYYSPIGNSDVPYPVAVGDVNLYFLPEQRLISKQEFEREICPDNAIDLYVDYYAMRKISKPYRFKIIAKRI